jgi:hypothetical protein
MTKCGREEPSPRQNNSVEQHGTPTACRKRDKLLQSDRQLSTKALREFEPEVMGVAVGTIIHDPWRGASMPLTGIGLRRMQCEEVCTRKEIKDTVFETAGAIHGNGREK